MNDSSFEISPRLVRPLVPVLLIISLIVGVFTFSIDNGVTVFKNGALFIGTAVTNWMMNRIETVLKASNLPVPDRRSTNTQPKHD